jgi:hypothetical protein
MGTYNFLDLASKGRDEEGLAFSMSWSAIMIAMRKVISQIGPRNTSTRGARPCCSGKSHP